MRNHLEWLGPMATLVLATPPAEAQTVAACPDCGSPIPDAAPIKVTALLHHTYPANGQDHAELFRRDANIDRLSPQLRSSHSLVIGDDHESLTLHAVRRFARRRSPAEASLVRRDKISTAMLGLRYDLQAGADDRVGLSIDGGVERRRFASDVLAGKWSTSRSMRLGGDWTHNRNWRVSAAYAITAGSQRLTGLQRSVELTQGGTSSRRGYRAALDFSPTGYDAKTRLTLGLEAGSDHLSNRDAFALGAANGSDRRLTANMTWKF